MKNKNDKNELLSLNELMRRDFKEKINNFIDSDLDITNLYKIQPIEILIEIPKNKEKIPYSKTSRDINNNKNEKNNFFDIFNFSNIQEILYNDKNININIPIVEEPNLNNVKNKKINNSINEVEIPKVEIKNYQNLNLFEDEIKKPIKDKIAPINNYELKKVYNAAFGDYQYYFNENILYTLQNIKNKFI